MTILGISAFYHDSAAAIIEDGKIIAAAQEERFSRKKHDAAFPIGAIKFCLEFTGNQLNDLDAVVFYDKPLLKFERLLETYYAFAPKGISSFLASMPVWLREKMFLKRLIYKELNTIERIKPKEINLLFTEHHLSHAASAFYPSPFEESAILTIDGVGEWATASICHGINGELKILKELKFPHSLGLLYSAFTYFLGFKVNSGEYKLMGLAPYGKAESQRVKEYLQIIKKELISIKEDGSIWLNQKYFNYATGLKMIHTKKWEKIFKMKRRGSETELQEDHFDLAQAIQQITEEVILKMAHEAKKITGSKNLCMAGGVALNCVANGKLQKASVFEKIYIQPAAGDAGGAIGAALAAYHIYFDNPKISLSGYDGMNGSYLGPDYSDIEVERMSRRNKASFEKLDFCQLCSTVASLLDQGNVVGWMQGRMEFGPRALGGRSILGDARNQEMQKKLNLKIKFRESFRPFAPSVLEEEINNYFQLDSNSPYMLLVQPINSERKKELPSDYHTFSFQEKLYTPRSDIPAVTHVDFSARIQSVHKETNPKFYQLISSFKKLTGYGLVVNTSFNVRGEPIVCTPDDAYQCFMRTNMDILVINDYLFTKTSQPKWKEQDDWRGEFKLD